MEKPLRLPRLEEQDASSEHALASIIKASDLPTKSEVDALRTLRDREWASTIAFGPCLVDTYLDRSDLKFYSMGQSDSAETNEKYSGEFYDTLLFNLSAPPRPVNPRYAKVQLDEAEFDFSRAHIDRDFLYQPQQAELFASPAGSWSDVHFGINFQ